MARTSLNDDPKGETIGMSGGVNDVSIGKFGGVKGDAMGTIGNRATDEGRPGSCRGGTTMRGGSRGESSQKDKT